MIIDSHAHVWVNQPEKYPWSPIGGYVPDIAAPVEELIKVMDANQVDGTILVQPTPYGWDNRYMLDAAARYPERLKTVCLVDPFDSKSRDTLGLLVREAGVKGLRINWQLHPRETWEKSPAHKTLWDSIGKLGVPVSLQCTPDHYSLLKTMSRRYPEIRIVVDHLGRPVPGCGADHPEFNSLLGLAEEQNIYLKISGMYYYSLESQPFGDTLPMIQNAIRAFGARRCLWGSDFPFIMDRWSYSSLLDAIREYKFLSEEDLDWLLGRTSESLWWNE